MLKIDAMDRREFPRLPGCGPLTRGNSQHPRPLRQQILDYVRASGQVPRVDVAKDLGISPATVTTITSDLIEQGWLEEARSTRKDSDAGRGRPPVALSVRPSIRLVAGMKLSDESHSAVILDFAGNRVAHATLPRSPGPMDLAHTLHETEVLFQTLLESAGLAPDAIAAVGLGLPGLIEYQSGEVLWSPIISDRHFNLRNAISERLGVPVEIDNDANMVTLAELWFGGGRTLSDFAVVTIEHGVGMGLVLGGELFRGSRGLGMEIGHTKVQLDGALCRCGQRGCLEAYVADYALVREASTALNPFEDKPRNTSEMLESLHRQAKAGDKAAQTIFRRAGRYLAFGLANIVNMFDPSLIILSGERMQYDALYAKDVLAEMDDLCLGMGRTTPPVEINAWGDLVWAQGAGALALTVVTDQVFASADI